MSDMFSKNAEKAIEKAIDKASKKFCRKVNLDDFDLSNRRLQNDCRQFFGGAMANERQNISEDQDALDLISYSATWGWLYGYSCAQEEALSTISAEDDEMSYQGDEIERSSSEQSNDQENSTGRTEETANSESSPDNDFVESEELESSDEEEILRKLEQAKHWCFGLAAALAVAIIIIITDWPF